MIRRPITKTSLPAALGIFTIAATGLAIAQDALNSPAGLSDADELANKMANSAANMNSVSNPNNFDAGGDPTGDGFLWEMNTLAVSPFEIKEYWNLVPGIILPVIQHEDVAVGLTPTQDASKPLDHESSGHAGKSADEIARELANPNNSLASLTFKNQYRLYGGDLPGAGSQDNFTVLFQPVFPFSLEPTSSGGKANLFVRPAIPILFEQPVFEPATASWDEVTGIGDIGFDIGYGVTEKNGFLWALGMVGTLPTATDSRIAGGQLRLGPEALLAKFEEWGLYGIFPSHQWDVTGWRDGQFNTTQVQTFLNFLPGGGWKVGSNPIMNYNWATEDWTIPLNLTVGKTVMFGKTPVKLEVDVNYYLERPDAFGSDWMIGFNVTPVVTNFVEKWILGN